MAEYSTQSGINSINNLQAHEFLYPGIYEGEAYVWTR